MGKMLRRLSLGALALGAAAVWVPVHAQQMPGPPDSGSDQLHAVGAGMGAIKDVARYTRTPESHVGMPGPIDPEQGPVAAGSEFLPSRGNAIVHPTGGSFVSPKQQADREIQKLIRKLG